MDNNKLIAEFMGLETPDGCYFEHLTKEGNRELTHHILLQYHTSWDWLMPVVAKCTELNDDEFDNEGIAWALLSNSIVDAYDHVLCFIQEYNLTPKEVV